MYEQKLKDILFKSIKIKTILERLEKYYLKDYYITAGSISQTVFNYYHNYDLDYGINDVDIVYYDIDTSYEKEDKIIKEIQYLLKDININLDIKNEARVYLWYNKKYNKNIKQYKNVEEAISSWISTVTCIGVRLENDNLKVFAPCGLEDLFNLIIRPNLKSNNEEQYIEKTKKWKQKWPNLKIIYYNDIKK